MAGFFGVDHDRDRLIDLGLRHVALVDVLTRPIASDTILG